MKKLSFNGKRWFKAIFFGLTLVSGIVFINACSKDKTVPNSASPGNVREAKNKTLTRELTIASIRVKTDGNPAVALFNENQEVFHVPDAAVLADLQKALATNTKLNVTFDPWQAEVLKVAPLTDKQKSLIIPSQPNSTTGTATKVDFKTMSADMFDTPERIGVINTITPGVTNVIPDMATAQLMFNYITKQCCQLPGPYGIDYCISFQYAEDGCYARAHKMCYILNTKYHYATHKIFSFANVDPYTLSVKAQKWGGCCINWWYHVAPLVNIKTAAGTKAYVFDPAMFDQPVLLSAWLHAQENPDCASGNAHVSMINLQPNSSFWPNDGYGLSFDPDPTFSITNSTLVSYSDLVSCP